MKSCVSEQPSMASSSSSSSVSSSPSSSPRARAQTPEPEPKPERMKSNTSTSSAWSTQKIAVALFAGAAVISVSFVCIWPSERLPFHKTNNTCSLFGNRNESCATETEDVPASHHRGKVIGADFNAADLVAAYQSIKTEYESLALHPTSTTNWQVLSSHADGSTVSLLEHPTDPSCPYVRMVSVMPGTIQEVWDFLDLKNWETSMPKMDPFYEGLTVLGDYKHRGIDMKLARKTIKRLVTFGKRDFTFVSVSDHPRGDGAWVSGTVSVLTDQIPREKGYVRAYQDSIAFYEAMPDDPETGKPQMKLTIVFRLDLNDSRDGGDGGYVPMWIYVKTVGNTGMASVQNMKRQLLLEAEQRESTEASATCDNKKWLARIRNGTNKC